MQIADAGLDQATRRLPYLPRLILLLLQLFLPLPHLLHVLLLVGRPRALQGGERVSPALRELRATPAARFPAGLPTALLERWFLPRGAAYVSRKSPSQALPVVRSGARTLPGPSAPTASRGEATASVGAPSDGGPHHRRCRSWLTAIDTNRRGPYA